MRHSKFIQFTALAALVTLGAEGAALAEPKAIDRSGRSEIAALTNAPTSLIQAIRIAENRNGGKVFSIDGISNNGSVYYKISSISDGKIHFVTLDPANGRILNTKTRNLIERLFNREEDGEMSGRVKALHVNLIKAVQTAERQEGGPAIEARIKKNDSSTITIQVEVVKNGAVKKVLLDGITNNILKAAVARKRDSESEDN
jgi:uncharacterized membrane protein YkoI